MNGVVYLIKQTTECMRLDVGTDKIPVCAGIAAAYHEAVWQLERYCSESAVLGSSTSLYGDGGFGLHDSIRHMYDLGNIKISWSTAAQCFTVDTYSVSETLYLVSLTIRQWPLLWHLHKHKCLLCQTHPRDTHLI